MLKRVLRVCEISHFKNMYISHKNLNIDKKPTDRYRHSCQCLYDINLDNRSITGNVKINSITLDPLTQI